MTNTLNAIRDKKAFSGVYVLSLRFFFLFMPNHAKIIITHSLFYAINYVFIYRAVSHKQKQQQKGKYYYYCVHSIISWSGYLYAAAFFAWKSFFLCILIKVNINGICLWWRLDRMIVVVSIWYVTIINDATVSVYSWSVIK